MTNPNRKIWQKTANVLLTPYSMYKGLKEAAAIVTHECRYVSWAIAAANGSAKPNDMPVLRPSNLNALDRLINRVNRM